MLLKLKKNNVLDWIDQELIVKSDNLNYCRKMMLNAINEEIRNFSAKIVNYNAFPLKNKEEIYELSNAIHTLTYLYEQVSYIDDFYLDIRNETIYAFFKNGQGYEFSSVFLG